MSVQDAIEAYYEALRRGDPLEPFFAADPHPVKFGITEALHGYDDIVDGLRTQTRTTDDWEVESHHLETGARGDVGWFSDHVTMRWRELEADRDISWETRWSGTLVKTATGWKFVRMHVSAAEDEV